MFQDMHTLLAAEERSLKNEKKKILIFLIESVTKHTHKGETDNSFSNKTDRFRKFEEITAH